MITHNSPPLQQLRLTARHIKQSVTSCVGSTQKSADNFFCIYLQLHIWSKNYSTITRSKSTHWSGHTNTEHNQLIIYDIHFSSEAWNMQPLKPCMQSIILTDRLFTELHFFWKIYRQRSIYFQKNVIRPVCSMTIHLNGTYNSFSFATLCVLNVHNSTHIKLPNNVHHTQSILRSKLMKTIKSINDERKVFNKAI